MGLTGGYFEFPACATADRSAVHPKKEIPSQGAVPLEIPRSQKLGVMTLTSTVINRVSQWFRRKNANKICVFEKERSIIQL